MAVAILKEARRRVSDWPLERDSFDALAKGLEKTYRRGRGDFGAATREPRWRRCTSGASG